MLVAASLRRALVATRRVGLPRLPLAPLAARLLASSVPQTLRRPHQQKNRRRDDALLPRMEAAIPHNDGVFVHAWLSSWDEPRAGIAKLRSDVWTMPLRTDIIHRCVTWERACMRQGTSKTKHRSEVRGGGKKPRPQKGSGRARAGSIRSPLWVGGGHAHPKRPRDFSYRLNRKVVTLGLKTALSDKYRRNALIVLRDLQLESNAPDELEARLTGLGLSLDKQRVMIITRSGDEPQPRKPRQPKMLPYDWSKGSPDDAMIKAAGRYREGLRPVNAFTAQETTTLNVCKHSVLVVSLDALAELHDILTRERHTGHRWVPLGPPEYGVRPIFAQPGVAAQEQAQAQAGFAG